MRLYFKNLNKDIEQGLDILSTKLSYERHNAGLVVNLAESTENILSVVLDKKQASFTYQKKIHLFRALSILMQKIKENDFTETRETCYFETTGIMFDVSQGSAVIKCETMKDILENMAVMGLSMLMIYMEDSFVLKNHPYFGYMRPKYTEEQLRAIDDHADILGIEVIPVMQSLAHLIDVIKWPQYAAFADTADILMVGDERTYAFVEDMIVQASKPFRSKNIHIGMDEAWKIGRGNYEDKYGHRSKHELMKEHLDRVVRITDKYGLKPMIWSDMFFNTFDLEGYGNNYNPDAPIADEIIENMPKSLGLVFWEYNHTDEAFYEKVIRRHQEFQTRVYFAGGVYNCFGFGVNNGLARQTIKASINACKKKGVRDTFLTVWGDDTTENDIFSLLLSFQMLAENCYRDHVSQETLNTRFSACTGCVADDFDSIRYLDEVPGVSVKDNLNMCNPSKYLLWQNALLPLFDKNIAGKGLGAHYQKQAEAYRQAIGRNRNYQHVFEIASALCDVLAVKAELGINLYDAYVRKDKAALQLYVDVILPDLIKRYEKLRITHRSYWFKNNKPEGFDVIDLRYGTQFMWLDTAIYRLDQYLSGEIDDMAEFDNERLLYPTDRELPFVSMYSKMVSASRISQSDTFGY